MSLRCELYGAQNSELPQSCVDRSLETDPQTLNQQADYAIQQCRQDFRDPNASTLTGCCTYLCFESLQTDYDAVDASDEVGLEKQRDLCRKFRQLAYQSDTQWCAALTKDCTGQ